LPSHERRRASGPQAALLLSLWLTAPVNGAEPRFDDHVRECFDHVNHERYGEAFDCSSRLKEAFPESGAGAFVAAIAYQTRMNDYRVRRFEAEFEREIAQAVALARRELAQRPNVQGRFLLGAAESYRSVHLFRQGRWLKAVRAAVRGTSLLQQAHEQEPAFADPLLGLALYEHARSKLRLLGIRLLGGSAARVDARLLQAERGARFVSTNAAYARQYVLVDRGRYRDALAVNEGLIARFPGNPVCLYNRALILERLGRDEDAGPAWRRLVEVLEAFPPASDGFLAECWLHLGRIAREAGRADEAATALGRARAHLLRRHADDELEGPYQPFESVRAAILDALAGEVARTTSQPLGQGLTAPATGPRRSSVSPPG
jgi:tetratricopeptide (TPR) repeat protein